MPIVAVNPGRTSRVRSMTFETKCLNRCTKSFEYLHPRSPPISLVVKTPKIERPPLRRVRRLRTRTTVPATVLTRSTDDRWPLQHHSHLHPLNNFCGHPAFRFWNHFKVRNRLLRSIRTLGAVRCTPPSCSTRNWTSGCWPRSFCFRSLFRSTLPAFLCCCCSAPLSVRPAGSTWSATLSSG